MVVFMSIWSITTVGIGFCVSFSFHYFPKRLELCKIFITENIMNAVKQTSHGKLELKHRQQKGVVFSLRQAILPRQPLASTFFLTSELSAFSHTADPRLLLHPHDIQSSEVENQIAMRDTF